MAPDHGYQDWTQLPADLLELIARKTLDAVSGLTPFRSVCRAWRAAAAEEPRLLVPAPRNGNGQHTTTLVFPVARGWAIIVDVRDTSCHLSHLATGATAALPNLNAVRAAAAGARVVRHVYEYLRDDQGEQAPPVTVDGRAQYPRNFRVKAARLRLAAADSYRRRYRRPRRQVRMDPRWEDALRLRGTRPVMFSMKVLHYYCGFGSYLGFSNCFRFAVHVPAAGAPAACSGGVLVIMYHMLQGKTGLVFSRPGDAAWTKLDNPVVVEEEDDDDGPSHTSHFHDFAYFNGKIFALDRDGVTAVFDAATLEVVDIIDVPPETVNLITKLYGPRPRADHPDDEVADADSEDYLHLVALPSKVLMVRTRARSSEPESFDVFELGTDDDDNNSRIAWCKVAGHGGIGGGGYDLFLDGYHATFGSNGGGRGDRIYYVHDYGHQVPSAAAYCYSVQDDRLECVYKPPEEVDESECTMKPTWFVP